MDKLITLLNKQVSNLGVLFVKLHHYHWYVTGMSFLALHEKFEELYDDANEFYDEVAERILALNGKPVANMKSYLQLTSLAEATGEESVKEMIQSVANDLKLLVTEFKEVIKLAEDNKDLSTADMFTSKITEYEKQIWMLTSLLK